MANKTIVKTDKLPVAAGLLANGGVELFRAERTDSGYLFHLRTNMSGEEIKKSLIEYERIARIPLYEIFDEMDDNLQRALLIAVQLKKAVGRICY